MRGVAHDFAFALCVVALLASTELKMPKVRLLSDFRARNRSAFRTGGGGKEGGDNSGTVGTNAGLINSNGAHKP